MRAGYCFILRACVVFAFWLRHLLRPRHTVVAFMHRYVPLPFRLFSFSVFYCYARLRCVDCTLLLVTFLTSPVCVCVFTFVRYHYSLIDCCCVRFLPFAFATPLVVARFTFRYARFMLR